MPFTISPFKIKDYDAVLRLWQESPGIGLSGADSRDNIRRYLDRNPALSFICKVEGQIVGAVLGGHDGRRGYIYHLAVKPEWRRQGIGRRLVEMCLDALARAGIQRCHIFIFNDNAEGIAFWKAIGWEPPEDIHIISKTIAGCP